MPDNNCFLIIPASGNGSRMKTNMPKQYLKLENGLSILDQSLKTLLKMDDILGCVVAIPKDDEHFRTSAYQKHGKMLAIAQGGQERFHSVLNALNTLSEFANENDWVLVHDAVRPCIKASDVQSLINQLRDGDDGGILATPVVDTLKLANASEVRQTVDREDLFQAQTPQMFKFGVLVKALENVVINNIHTTDEAEAVAQIGGKVKIVIGSKNNIKITVADDLQLANYYIENNNEN
ncbi:MAG TPA: 2-C-methyl-D-erythritol 4-phosphate cytidylyltransferase [Candidatus Thioglobus sp.]|jgi:2-C-methyl-D-erythritol 4-phosphate cytidylyltransferase|nr:2-C-methyl-D-erythritol 4-phosphate cytidylyltransferase [Candidatus Thioglobus sp.]HIL21435.1 2-C-methyl-D-erythritol 4-phosphate cytidylyltransferase [Candidatus Thioglobus sp.]